MDGRPIILDLYCSAGGAACGYHRAGFQVVGVDCKPQPRYPYAFIQCDALAYLRSHWNLYDAIHASPPCHGSSVTKGLSNNPDTAQLAACRDILPGLGLPYIIENVPGAVMRPDLRLSGQMFGLRLKRVRWFELNWFCMSPGQAVYPRHWCAQVGAPTVVGNGDLGCSHALWDKSMGIDWMTLAELTQAIPPAYTQYIGSQLLLMLANKK